MPLLREGVRLHFKLYLMPLPSPRSGFVQQLLKVRENPLPFTLPLHDVANSVEMAP
uniref:Uncharacterized protein n=1 Tax=Candidatus Kentrum sp. MB TaxID=2138164 RepID=A0A450Y217_9GAMM|nr:MAG: hypothetical protein BECKMB1821I_GA0114274_11302 [Candidatus Kentron sp. MB]VFK77366.1 MAG: hypothetical protein BECKMB1821H_GA0114242_11292 [Candidatus Kentron sp. MB]